jgi:hypothetical protein
MVAAGVAAQYILISTIAKAMPDNTFYIFIVL